MMIDLDKETTDKIKDHYLKGQGSIQDIARVYRVEVGQVLHIIGQDEMLNVESGGDMIDSTEAGPGAQMNYSGQQFNVPYSVD